MFYLGIDGGGSGCRARIENAQGELLGTGESGPANLVAHPERAFDNLREAYSQALANAQLAPAALKQTYTVLGLAGYNLAVGREQCRGWQLPFAKSLLTTDTRIAQAGAHQGGEGAVLVLGTGSVASAVINGQEHVLGGYGLPIGDQASGASLGLLAVQASLQMLDHLQPRTALLDAVLESTGVADALGLSELMVRASSTEFARLAPVVVSQALAGEPVSRALIDDAVVYVGRIIARLKHLGASRISLVGGLAPVLAPFLPESIQGQLTPAVTTPVAGAVLLARQLSHHNA